MSADTPDEPEGAPSLAVSPPPVGVVVSSMLTWEELTTYYGHLEAFWIPADGRPMRDGAKLETILDRGGKTGEPLPDLRTKALAGDDATAPQHRWQARAVETENGEKAPSAELTFYFLTG